MRTELGAACLALVTSFAAAADDLELPLSIHGHIESFMYSHRGPDNWIDTIAGLESELVRYRHTYLVFRFENETDMGHGSQPNMPFDPNRGRWLLSLTSRTELAEHFFEVGLRHDCFHGIDRWIPGQDFKDNQVGVGFGTRGYLQKYRFAPAGPMHLNYYVAPALYVPRGDPWQRQPYLARLEADARLDLFRLGPIGLGLESVNVFYYADQTHEVQRSHLVNLEALLYGNAAALLMFAGYWPYDDQVFRNRQGKVVGGLELSF
jgi:hypothetical protein